MGDAIIPLINDIKDATLKVLQSEFNKVTVLQNTNFKKARGQEESAQGDILD